MATVLCEEFAFDPVIHLPADLPGSPAPDQEEQEEGGAERPHGFFSSGKGRSQGPAVPEARRQPREHHRVHDQPFQLPPAAERPRPPRPAEAFHRRHQGVLQVRPGSRQGSLWSGAPLRGEPRGGTFACKSILKSSIKVRLPLQAHSFLLRSHGLDTAVCTAPLLLILVASGRAQRFLRSLRLFIEHGTSTPGSYRSSPALLWCPGLASCRRRRTFGSCARR